MKTYELKSRMIRVFVTEREYAAYDALAYAYGMTLLDLVRAALRFCKEEKPELVVRVSPRKRSGPPAPREVLAGEEPLSEEEQFELETYEAARAAMEEARKRGNEEEAREISQKAKQLAEYLESRRAAEIERTVIT